ncbi:hypothetical protein [Nitrospirillum viridazoti]|uniref:GGDEF domain-containing protein n=1 Tax=Nitrospirillum viridazoti CBAmc TaxID=1441467 RepID=A0A248JR63_9PROT|nr:hypothetical protein [Nitrospirillum amazonense]ASG20704.1 hypothetical protein Y958_07710 [Nitrospirillum amazonense CBAmc]TWB37973.1 hypothetical protein FBZ91_107287 [Nitrospirillum amazonense]
MDGLELEQSSEQFLAAAPKLRAIFRAQNQACAGSLHMVGLDSLRERLGTRWPRVADRVHMLAERLLGQLLTPKDTWFRHGEEGYIVVFAQLGKREAGLVCAKVVEQLQRLLLGDVDTAAVRVHSAVHQMGRELLFQSNSLNEMLAGAATLAVESTTAATVAETGKANAWWTHAALQEQPAQVVYRPIWDVRKEVLSIYMARIMRPRRGRQPLWGYDCVADPQDMQQILALDMEVLRQTMEVYGELYANQFRCFLSVPVHFETLASVGRRREYLSALQAVPRELRAFLAFHLVGFPQGIPASRAAEMVAFLKQFSRVVTAIVENGSQDLPALAAAGVYISIILLPPGASPKHWAIDLKRFSHEATRLRMRAGIKGVDTAAMASCADDAGFHYMAGDFIGPWSEVPENALRFTRNDLRARMDAGRRA